MMAKPEHASIDTANEDESKPIYGATEKRCRTMSMKQASLTFAWREGKAEATVGVV